MTPTNDAESRSPLRAFLNTDAGKAMLSELGKPKDRVEQALEIFDTFGEYSDDFNEEKRGCIALRDEVRALRVQLAEQIEPFNALHAEVAAKDERIAELECNIGTYRSILDEKNNDIAALTKRKDEAEYESASWKRQLDTLREQHDAHTARVKMETLRYAAQVCEGLMPETAIADDVLHVWCEAAIECAETLDKLADQTAKEAQP